MLIFFPLCLMSISSLPCLFSFFYRFVYSVPLPSICLALSCLLLSFSLHPCFPPLSPFMSCSVSGRSPARSPTPGAGLHRSTEDLRSKQGGSYGRLRESGCSTALSHPPSLFLTSPSLSLFLTPLLTLSHSPSLFLSL